MATSQNSIVPSSVNSVLVPMNVPVTVTAPNSQVAPSNVTVVGTTALVPDGTSMAYIPANVNQVKVPVGANSANSAMQKASSSNSPQQCSLPPPSTPNKYCTPAPFETMNGERYFPVAVAYGRGTL